MQKLLALVVLTSFASAFASAQEPIRFRGAYIGQPLSDYVDCSGRGKLLKEGYKMHGKLCEGKKGTVWRSKVRGFLDTKEEGEAFLFENQKLFRILIYVPNEDWDKVRYDLTQKLGEPQSEVPQVFQNGFGAHWEFEQGFWLKGDTVAYAKINVDTAGRELIRNPLTGRASTRGIEVTVTDAEHAKLPETRPSTLD